MKYLICLFLMIGCGTTSATKHEPRETSALSLTPTTQTLNPFYGDKLMEPDSFKKEERLARLQAMPHHLSIEEVGFVYRPPRGWTAGNPRSHMILNDTKFAVR